MRRKGNRIIDENGRTLILRGVNMGGSSKRPCQAGNSGNTGKSSNTQEAVSFVGRPFPPEEADGHFERLKNFGFTFIRFIITWEALEHAGPGIYDESYIDYLKKILKAARNNGIRVLMDPHQDVWSRWTGGDGAPRWTLEKLGMNVDKLDATGAAITANDKKAFAQKEALQRKEAFPQKAMIWPVNYSLYAAATMFTLFFAGNTFAPDLKIDGENAQDFLQKRYIEAFRHCYRQLKGSEALAAISGWGVMNEPHPGFIGHRCLGNLENATLALGPVPSPFEAMLAASGQPVNVPVYKPWIKGWRVARSQTINPEGLSLFREGFTCPWKQAGVWAGDGDNAKLIRPDHFAKYKGQAIRFTDDFLKPFILRFIESFSGENQPALFFIEGIPHSESPSWSKKDPENTVNAFHHYDGFTLFTKSYRPYLTVDSKAGKIILGKKKNAAHYTAKLAEAKTWAKERMDDMPCLLGEFGIPFDLNRKTAYKSGDYRLHEHALSRYYDGIDENLLSSTIWNYTADNTHEEGDHWNSEDFSIVTSAFGTPASQTGTGRREIIERAARGWLRPYPMATAGIPLKFNWNRKEAVFFFLFSADSEIKAPTEIFIPSRWFGEAVSINIEISSELPNSIEAERKQTGPAAKLLRPEYHWEEQKLYIYNDGYNGEAELIVRPKG